MPTQTKVVSKLTNSDNIIVEEKQDLKVTEENSVVWLQKIELYDNVWVFFSFLNFHMYLIVCG